MKSVTLIAGTCALIMVLILSAAARAETSKKKTGGGEFTMKPIGSVHKEDGRTTLVLKPEYEPGLLGLDGFSHVWVFWWFDRNDTPQKRSITQVHPRGNRKNPLTGVFATRAPVRPNLIGMTLCRVLSVTNNVVEVDKIDAFAETAILDLKPYTHGNDRPDEPLSFPDWL